MGAVLGAFALVFAGLPALAQLCQKKVASVYERTKVTRLWVETMDRFGWYWLGNDVLEDTMHLEFLGDPDKILAPLAPAGGGAPTASN